MTDTLLLTGATGTVGPHLLAHLLQRHEAVTCLVRASDETAGLARIEHALRTAGYAIDDVARRVHALPGDLAAPRFGLTAARYSTLTANVRHVIHNAAWLGQKEHWSEASLANVTGTTSIVELCARAGARLDHVSTIGALRWTLEDQEGLLQELTYTEHPEPSETEDQYAYYFTKWMAEQLALYAAERVPVTVHRLGDVYSHAGDAPLSALVNAVATLRSLPADDRLSWAQHSISDELAGRAIARIADLPPAPKRVLHAIGFVDGVTVADVRQGFRERGIELATLDVASWIRALREQLPWLAMLEEWQFEYLLVPRHPRPRYVNPGFAACLRACGLSLPSPGDRLAPVLANVLHST